MSADILLPPTVTASSTVGPLSGALPAVPTTPPRRLNAVASGSTPVTPATASPRTSFRLRGKRQDAASPVPPQTPVLAPPAVDPGPEFVQPAEFSPINNNALKVVVMPGQYLSPEDDKLATRGIPIFRPTLEEFEDFEGYVTRTVAWGQYSGIVKVIPPEGWKKTLPPIPSSALAEVQIKTPIQQNMLGQAGLFRAQNVEKNKNRPLSIQEWFNKSMDKRFIGPGPKDLDPTLDRDSDAWKQRREEAIKEVKRKKEEARQKRLAAAARREQRLAAGATAQANGALPTDLEELALNGEAEDTEQQVDSHIQADTISNVPSLDPSAHSPPSSHEDEAKTPESDPATVPEWYRHFDPSTAWLPKDTRPEDYTPEACANLERKYWKTMGLGEPSWYGADLQGTLFPDPDTKWNVAHLPNLLNRLGRELPGVNRPYLYFGMWRAAFAWHVEDMDLFSINYIHFGAPKFWYAIPQGQAEAFERTITSYFPREAAECDQFLRHKAYLMSPTRLAKDGIHVNELVHNQGEFVITYPRGYHAGFNLGFNCAESVNFALDSWVELGRRAKVCQCVSHSVRIDMDELLGQSEYAKQQASIQAQEDILNAIEAERTTKNHKRPLASDEAPRKKARAHSAIAGEEGEDRRPDLKLEKNKKSIPIDKKPRPPSIVKAPTIFPCILCPDTSTEGLIPVHRPPHKTKATCKSADGIVRAHSVCVSSVPEVWVEDVVQDGNTVEVVRGVEGISKARWSLKCGSCQDKKLASMGAKVQCVNGKCPKAFHVTCARDDEQVVYRVWETEGYDPIAITEDAPPGTQHEFTKATVLKTEILCPNHNPQIKEAKKAQAARELKDKVMSLLAGQSVKVKTPRGVFEVKLVSVLEQEQKAEVEHEIGQRSLVKWTDFDFKPAVDRRVENEYAKDYVTRRTETGEVVQIGSHSHTSSPAPARVAPARPTPLPTSVSASASASASTTTQPAVQHSPVASASRHVDRPLGHAEPHDPQHIPSRVVIGDPDYRHPQYAYPPGYLPTPVQAMHTGYPSYPWAPSYPRAHGCHQPSHVFSHSQGYPAPGYPLVAPHHIHPQGHHVHSAGYSSAPTSTPPSGSAMSTPVSSARFDGQSPFGTQQNSGSNGVGRIGLGLERMSALMRAIPSLRVPAIHLAGTNGKGSVSAMLESVFLAAGLSVGRYNSPHLLEPRDAISLNGAPPSREAYIMAMARVSNANSRLQLSATTFELATAAAFDLINAQRPDIMIIECGMGGEGDATNVIPPDLVLASALTSVGLDHTAFLGDSVEAITKVKAGIAVPDGLFVVAPQMYNGVARVAGEVATARGARTIYADRAVVVSEPPHPLNSVSDLDSIPHRVIRTLTPGGVIDAQLGLAGEHQLDNASLAITILSVIRHDPRARHIQPKVASLCDRLIYNGVASARWPGRCELIRYPAPGGGIPVLVDGAHNADSASMLSLTIRSLGLPRDTPISWIIGLSDSKGKTPESVLGPLVRSNDNVFAVPFSKVEGMPWVQPVAPSTVVSIARQLSKGGRAEVRDDVQQALGSVAALDKRQRGLVVVCGSLYLVADFFRLVLK